MSRYALVLLSLAFGSGCMEGYDPPAVDETPDSGTGDDDDVGPLEPDAAVEDDGATPDGASDDDGSVPVGDAQFAVRSCNVTLRVAAPGATEVKLAGEFTDWDRGAMTMSDADRDGTFEVTLSPGGMLSPGNVYAYKVIVDGQWRLDSGSTYRKYSGDCLNSGFRMPACSAAPEISAERVRTTVTDTTGSADIAFTVRTAMDGARPDVVDVMLDDVKVDADLVTLDPETGRVTLTLADLALGKHTVALRVRDEMGRDADPVDLPFWVETEAFDWRDTTMYMLVVDRFANGDRDIDRPEGVEYAADYHGGDLQGALEVLRSGYFENLGIRAIWLSPINQQAEGHFAGRDDANQYTGYHGYWPSRGREVEPRFGGNEALKAFVDEAHARGIRVLLDLINNQVHQQHEYYTAHPEWFRTGCVCGIDAGCDWSERPLDCLFASYLPDINWRVPAAEDQFIGDAMYWLESYGIDGYRIDAVKHVETNSIFNLRAAVASRFEQGGNRVLMVGETAVGQWDHVDYGCGEIYDNGYQWIDAYTGQNGLDGQFDFPTHHRMQAGLVDGSLGYDTLEAIVSEAESLYRPDGLHVRFLGSHDMPRMATRAQQSPKQNCRWPGSGDCATLATPATDAATYARLRRAMTVMMTLPGVPFLYYGDEVGMPGGGDPDNRRDMFFPAELASVSMASGALRAEQESLRDLVASLGRARASSSALRRGRRLPLVSESDLYVVGYRDDVGAEVALVVVNRGAAITRMIPSAVLGTATSLELAAGTGTASFSGANIALQIGAGEAAIFVSR